jgi:hypothetical protein
VKAEALDANRRAVASVNDPLGLHPLAQPRPERVLEPHALLDRQPLGWHGASLELWLAKGSKGNDCIQVRNTGNPQTRRWLCDPAVGRDSGAGMPPPSLKPQPVYYAVNEFTHLGQPGGYTYASGWAGPPVASVEIRFQDSTVERLTLHRGYFIYVVPEPVGVRQATQLRDRTQLGGGGRLPPLPVSRCALCLSRARQALLGDHLPQRLIGPVEHRGQGCYDTQRSVLPDEPPLMTTLSVCAA